MNRRRRNSLHEVETSPDGRYIRFDEKLGSGAYKDVYLSYDTETGQEVAWNTVYLGGLPADEQERIRGETAILKSLSHPAIISFGNTWESSSGEEIHFTTEIVTSGTLKQYINRVKGIKLKIIKMWSVQHSPSTPPPSTPPPVHPLPFALPLIFSLPLSIPLPLSLLSLSGVVRSFTLSTISITSLLPSSIATSSVTTSS